MLSWENLLLCWVYCTAPLRHAEVLLSCLMARLQHNLWLTCFVLSEAISHSRRNLISASCPVSGKVSCQEAVPIPNSSQISSSSKQDFGTLDPVCPKTLSTWFSNISGRKKCSLKCAICYFLIENSTPSSQRSLLKWIFCSSGLHYLFSMILLTSANGHGFSL